MPDATWKAVERRIAGRLRGQRQSNHALGLQTSDVETAWLSVEIKHRRRLPAWLRAAVDQAARNATEDKLAIVLLHEKGRRHDNDLVVVRLADFEDWFGSLLSPESEETS